MIKKILIIVIILILILLALLFIFGQRQIPVAGDQLIINNQVNNQQITNQQVSPPKELTAEEKLKLQKNELMLKARNFIERYGSYSSDAKFANLIELKNEMSNKLWQETERYINQKEKSFDEAQDKEFYGVSTKVLNIAEKKFSENEAIYSISSQRQEIKGTTQKVYYQDAELTIIKENGGWEVDNIKWK